jgi:hypothetical protein
MLTSAAPNFTIQPASIDAPTPPPIFTTQLPQLDLCEYIQSPVLIIHLKNLILIEAVISRTENKGIQNGK